MKIIPAAGIKEKIVTNYNSTNKPRTNKHREELLLSLDSTSWSTFHGDGRSDNHKEEHVITVDPIAMGYLILLDSEIASNPDIPTEVKVQLIRFVAFYFDRLLQWQTKQRGRKIGIFGNLHLRLKQPSNGQFLDNIMRAKISGWRMQYTIILMHSTSFD